MAASRVVRCDEVALHCDVGLLPFGCAGRQAGRPSAQGRRRWAQNDRSPDRMTEAALGMEVRQAAVPNDAVVARRGVIFARKG